MLGVWEPGQVSAARGVAPRGGRSGFPGGASGWRGWIQAGGGCSYSLGEPPGTPRCPQTCVRAGAPGEAGTPGRTGAGLPELAALCP